MYHIPRVVNRLKVYVLRSERSDFTFGASRSSFEETVPSGESGDPDISSDKEAPRARETRSFHIRHKSAARFRDTSERFPFLMRDRQL